MDSQDVDSAGVYYMSREDFESRGAPPPKPEPERVEHKGSDLEPDPASPASNEDHLDGSPKVPTKSNQS